MLSAKSRPSSKQRHDPGASSRRRGHSGSLTVQNSDLDRVLLAEGPFIDLRSPGEFAAGAVPGAVNLPLLTDDERHQVGLTFKQEGQEAAIAMGERLVSGSTKETRIQDWANFIHAHPDASLYCWRGGLRSETAQRWLADRGLQISRIQGGFKALRRRCLDVLDQAPGGKLWYVLGGRTGTGKTVLLNRLPGSIDLEGLANHRGSAFGAAWTPQPPPVTFECALAVAYLGHDHPWLVLEDESRTIGRLGIPAAWHEAMQQAPLVILEADLEIRSHRICQEYVFEPLARGVAASTLLVRMRSALDRIARRLGGLRTKEVEQLLERGFANGDHQPWVERLLDWYYDPMYDYQLEGKKERVIFRGNMADTEVYLHSPGQ
jgi:tRNA 2-selenouridine synthase